MYIAPIIHLILGAGKSIMLNKKMKNVEKIIESYKGELDNYVNELSTFEALLAKDNILLAEYFYKRQKIIDKGDIEGLKKLWEGVKEKMRNNLEQVEKELESQHATKLDIAKLISGLRQIGGELEKDFLCLKEELQQELKRSIDTYAKEVEVVKERVENYFDFIKSSQSRLKFETDYDFFDFETGKEELRFEILSVQNKLKNDYDKLLKKFDLMQEWTGQEIVKIKERLKEMGKNFESLRVQYEDKFQCVMKDFESMIENLSVFNTEVSDVNERVNTLNKKLIDIAFQIEDSKAKIEKLKQDIDSNFSKLSEEMSQKVKILNYKIVLGFVACLILAYLFFG